MRAWKLTSAALVLLTLHLRAQEQMLAQRTPHSFWVTGDMHVSQKSIPIYRESLMAIEALFWIRTPQNEALAKRELSLSQREARGGNPGDTVLTIALSNLFNAKIQNAQVAVAIVKDQQKQPGVGGASEHNLQSSAAILLSNSVIQAISRRESACSLTIGAILNTSIAPKKITECELASIDPHGPDWPIETDPKLVAESPNGQRARYLSKACASGAAYALMRVDSMMTGLKEPLGAAVASERIVEALRLCRSSEERRMSRVLFDYQILQSDALERPGSTLSQPNLVDECKRSIETSIKAGFLVPNTAACKSNKGKLMVLHKKRGRRRLH